MELTRRHLLKSALVLGGVAAVSREMVFGSLSEEAVAAGRTTANGTYGPGAPNAKGYRKVVAKPADPRLVRTDLGVAAGARPREAAAAACSPSPSSATCTWSTTSPPPAWSGPTATTTRTPPARSPGIFASAYRPAGDALRPGRRRDGARDQRGRGRAR